MGERPAPDGPHVPVVYLETERLVLRRFTADDLDDLVALDGDPAVMRYITGGPPTPREEMRDDYLPFWLAYYDRGDRYGFWAAIERETGAFLGWFHLRPLPEDPDDEPELGYRLVRAAWGRGYATEGSHRADRQGVRRARRAARPRLHDGRQPGVAARDGEVRDALRADVRHGLAGPDRGRRGGRRRVRDRPRASGRPTGPRPADPDPGSGAGRTPLGASQDD